MGSDASLGGDGSAQPVSRTVLPDGKRRTEQTNTMAPGVMAVVTMCADQGGLDKG